MVGKVHTDECLFQPTIHEWFKRFEEGRKDLNEGECLERPRSVVRKENVVIVREFMKKKPKYSLHLLKILKGRRPPS